MKKRSIPDAGWATGWTDRRLRLVSGLVLFAFVVMHLLNHALGLVSLQAMEAGLSVFDAVWGGPAGAVPFYGALLLHIFLSLKALYRRRTLKMPVREALQIGFGLALPLLIVPHVVAVSFGERPDYAHVVHALWSEPSAALRQIAALLVAWIHGCLGLWFWLRARGWFAKAAPLLGAAAVLVPVLSILGFTSAGKEIAANLSLVSPRAASASMQATMGEIRSVLYAGFAFAVAGTLLARRLAARRSLKGAVRIRYVDGRSVFAPAGSSVLEASRMGGLPHVSACGGKGRCSTCRVRVVDGLSLLPPPTEAEAATLRRIGAPADVRLACQLRPVAELTVSPLVAVAARSEAGVPEDARAAGTERTLAVMFCDLRGFTRLTENVLPYDTVFLLNRYFAAIGEAVEGAGGRIDKFIGDGVLVLFGLDTPQDQACADALVAASRIVKAVATLERGLAAELGGARLRVAIGLHTGPAIVGRMGYGMAAGQSVVGDTINTASRLEGVAKENEMELVMSVEIARRAGLRFAASERRTVEIRGRNAALDVLMVPDAGWLEERTARGR